MDFPDVAIPVRRRPDCLGDFQDVAIPVRRRPAPEFRLGPLCPHCPPSPPASAARRAHAGRLHAMHATPDDKLQAQEGVQHDPSKRDKCENKRGTLEPNLLTLNPKPTCGSIRLQIGGCTLDLPNTRKLQVQGLNPLKGGYRRV